MTQSEKQFQQAVIDYALLHNWKIYHTYDSRKSVPGFPDLVLVRDRIIFAELKREGGKLTEAQTTWLDAIAKAGGDAFVWMPSRWNVIEEVLK